MLTNLFTIFEPTTSMGDVPLGWLSSCLILLWVRPYWVYLSRTHSLLSTAVLSLKSEMSLLFTPGTMHLTTIPLGLWLLISAMNMLGLLPHVFTGTSHLSLTLSLSLPVWAGLMMYAMRHHLQPTLAHLVPYGTPTPLMSFMVIIETVSTVIRPLTLAVRLSANMIAGHLLLALLGGVVSSLSILPILGSVVMLLPLLVLESAVALIQAYVFMTLVALYLSEV